MKLVIVESPTKAKTIRAYLGKDFHVLASMGHVRDLPESASDIPASVKDKPWAQLGVDIEHDFKPFYVVPSSKQKTVKALKDALKDADELYLATDEDREGESISAHLLEILKPHVPVHRMVFHEITPTAIQNALAHPRAINEHLVEAQETRRVLDRLVGYTISPVLWKKLMYGLSAGRVQSAALKAIVDRERLRLAFVSAGYWDVTAQFSTSAQESFEARLTHISDKRLASGKDFDENTGALKAEAQSNVTLLQEAEAARIAQEAPTLSWSVTDVQKKPVTRKPPTPFTTSTLQQEANRKLGLSSKETMRLAQSLYEEGYITYMRTDSTNLSDEAVRSIRGAVQSRFGANFLPATPRVYHTQAKGAQEAHEAIRPSTHMHEPSSISAQHAARALYELIWMRTLACQMTDSKQEQTSAQISGGVYRFQANGTRIVEPGFLRAYVEGSEDPSEALSDRETILPALQPKDALTCPEAAAQGHETKPPSRFTEAGLIQYLEKEGIGRPSTYASIITTLLDRSYVKKAGTALVPSFTGFVVTQFLEHSFPDLVNANFTSTMEETLDRIAQGEEQATPYLTKFFLGADGLQARVDEYKDAAIPDSVKEVCLPAINNQCVRVGRYGAYIETMHPEHHTPVKASFPDTLTPGDITQDVLNELLSGVQQGPTSLGVDPESGMNVYLKSGSFGPYVQLGEDPEDKKTKPKRASLPKQLDRAELDLEKALFLLSMPRLLGAHPESGKDVRVGLGRFGPYVVCDGDFRSLKGEDTIFNMTLARALELLAEPKKGGRGSIKTLRELGTPPRSKKPVVLKEGRYGAYVEHGTKRASLPKNANVDTFTLEEAIELIKNKPSKRGKK